MYDLSFDIDYQSICANITKCYSTIASSFNIIIKNASILICVKSKLEKPVLIQILAFYLKTIWLYKNLLLIINSFLFHLFGNLSIMIFPDFLQSFSKLLSFVSRDIFQNHFQNHFLHVSCFTISASFGIIFYVSLFVGWWKKLILSMMFF